METPVEVTEADRDAAREVLSRNVGAVIGEWDCSLRPDQIQKFTSPVSELLARTRAAAMEEGRADRERLDWLETSRARLLRPTDKCNIGFVQGGRIHQFDGDTVREAIDAARAAHTPATPGEDA